MSSITPICCGEESVWIENIPGKGYNFCTKCRNEVMTPEKVEEINLVWPASDDQFSFDVTYSNNGFKKVYADKDWDDELQDAIDQLTKGLP